MGKYILILYMTVGAAPVTPEHHSLAAAEFDDMPACQYVISEITKNFRGRVLARCFPKASKSVEAEPPK